MVTTFLGEKAVGLFADIAQIERNRTRYRRLGFHIGSKNAHGDAGLCPAVAEGIRTGRSIE
jgi:hypothetical protein